MRTTDPDTTLKTIRKNSEVSPRLLCDIADHYKTNPILAKSLGVNIRTLCDAIARARETENRPDDRLCEGRRKVQLTEITDPADLKRAAHEAVQSHRTGEAITMPEKSEEWPVGVRVGYLAYGSLYGLAKAAGMSNDHLWNSIARRRISVDVAVKLAGALAAKGKPTLIDDLIFRNSEAA
jgi:hypothetical protein